MRSKGAEKIGATLNSFFKPILDLVDKHGGDVIKFSGDALTIVWPTTEYCPGDESGNSFVETTSKMSTARCSRFVGRVAHKDDTTAALAASRFCIALQALVPEIGKTPIEDHHLTMHIGVGYGMVSLMQIGGLFGRWEYCLAGDALEQIAVAEPLAVSGETVLSPEARSLVEADLSLEDVDAGPGQPGFAKLLDERHRAVPCSKNPPGSS